MAAALTPARETSPSAATVSSARAPATNASIGVDGGSQLTITSQIRENSTHTNLTKEGTGTLFLTHANVYTGITEVHAGVLQIQNSLAVGGSSADGVVVDGRATLE